VLSVVLRIHALTGTALFMLENNFCLKFHSLRQFSDWSAALDMELGLAFC